MSIFQNNKIDGEDALQIRFELLQQYIANHKANTFGVPIAVVLFGLLFANWAPAHHVAVWIAIGLASSFWSGFVYRKFEKAAPGIDPRHTREWIAAIALPRFLFILNWASLVFWAWIPGEEVTLFIALMVVMTTISINASTSGPFLPLYFMEITPKVAAMMYVILAQGGVFYDSLAAMAFIGVVFVIKYAFGINRATRTLIQQKHDLARAKEEVERASRAKSAFLATMSHEVRTPLNGILGIVNLLKDTPLNTRQGGYVETIRYSGETLLALLNDILDFSKMEAGKLDIEEVEFDLRRLVKSVIDLLRSRAMEKGLKLSYHINMDVPEMVESDPTRLRQVLINLVSNAIKFTEAGQVQIAVTNVSEDGWDGVIKFEVHDTGIGIPDEAQALLFRDFTQADSSISRRYGGTGLGLSISKKIIGLMNGSIGMTSAPGEGSTFWFEIPVTIVDYDPSLYEEEAAEIPRIGQLDILLAEDNAVNRQVAVDMLEREGHRVAVALNGREALTMAQAQDYDLVLMDMQMPDMDGLEATQKIRELGGKHLSLPIIALTANAMRGDDERCKAAGMNDHVAKPINPARLYKVLAQYAPPEKRGVPKEQKKAAPAHPVPDKDVSGEIDLKNLADVEKTLGKEYLIDFLQKSLPEVKRSIDNLGRSCNGGMIRDMQHSAHEIKGMSALFGFRDLTALAEGVEFCCMQNKAQEARALAGLMEDRFFANVSVLQKIYPIEYLATQ